MTNFQSLYNFILSQENNSLINKKVKAFRTSNVNNNIAFILSENIYFLVSDGLKTSFELNKNGNIVKEADVKNISTNSVLEFLNDSKLKESYINLLNELRRAYKLSKIHE